MVTTDRSAVMCWRCRSIGPGRHDLDGRFDATSVEVTKAEIDAAIIAAARTRGRIEIELRSPDLRARVRYNIALGKHTGVYSGAPLCGNLYALTRVDSTETVDSLYPSCAPVEQSVRVSTVRSSSTGALALAPPPLRKEA